MKFNADQCLAAASVATGVTIPEIVGRLCDRQGGCRIEIAAARALYVALCREQGMSYPEAAKGLSRKSHSMALYAYRRWMRRDEHERRLLLRRAREYIASRWGDTGGALGLGATPVSGNSAA